MREKIENSLTLACFMAITACGCAPRPTETAVVQSWFAEQAIGSGLDFVHDNGMSGRFYDAEIFGPGVALFDYDNDGDLDAYLVQGRLLTSPVDGAQPEPAGRLFRNDLIQADGPGSLQFTDVTAQSGITTTAYGIGAATGDIDNDGDVDLYLTHLGSNQLFRNNGNGTFTDISRMAGVDDRGWSVPASFFDFDRDGWLDLFVGHYLDYSVENDQNCTSLAGARDYCAPTAYRPQPSRLYRNRGDGTFADVTSRALTGGDYGPALGAVTADFNRDGWPDLFVANDGQPDILWMNQKNGTFRNTALLAGAAFNASGQATASMGVDAGDFDNDGDEDLFHTNLTGEMNTLLVNNGDGTFSDRTTQLGLGIVSLPDTGFGTGWFDADNDGWLDLAAVNGAVRVIEALAATGDPFPLHQPRRLYRNSGGTAFTPAASEGGTAFQQSEVGRGMAIGDVDNDGDNDLLIGNNNGRVRLLINLAGQRSHWIGLRLLTAAGRDALGATVEITKSDGTRLWRRSRSDGSYGSASDPRVIAGLGATAAPASVRVTWPDGRMEMWNQVRPDAWTTLRQGGGTSP